MLRLSENETRLLRCRAQGLDPGRRDRGTAAEIVRGVCGVRAQLPRAAALALRARGGGLLVSDVVRARERERSVVRSWFMRGTLHLVAVEDAGWLLSLLGPVFVAAGRRRLSRLGLDEDATAKGVRAIGSALAEDGPSTRTELLERLRQQGIGLAPDDPTGYVSTHLLRRAAFEGVLCFGPDRDGTETYAPAYEWGVQPYRGPRENALAEFVRRYLAAHGPARPGDLAAWSGFPMRDVRAAWKLVEGDLQEVILADGPAWVLRGGPDPLEDPLERRPACVRLLPHFDPYLLGYRGRELAVSPRHARRVQRGGGFVRPVVVVDGRVIATWEYREGGQPGIAVQPFGEPDPAIEPSLEAEARDIGRFLGVEPALTIDAPA